MLFLRTIYHIGISNRTRKSCFFNATTAADGVTQKLMGVFIEHDEPLGNQDCWVLETKEGEKGVPAGKITSATYTLQLKRNITLAMIPIAWTEIGTQLIADTPHGRLPCTVTTLPFV